VKEIALILFFLYILDIYSIHWNHSDKKWEQSMFSPMSSVALRKGAKSVSLSWRWPSETGDGLFLVSVALRLFVGGSQAWGLVSDLMWMCKVIVVSGRWVLWPSLSVCLWRLSPLMRHVPLHSQRLGLCEQQ